MRARLNLDGWEIIVGAMVAMAFGLGVWSGGLVASRHAARELELGRACLEQVPQVNAAAGNLRDLIAQHKAASTNRRISQ